MTADLNNIDAHVDEEIYEALNPKDPKSFFLFAGAGSGKTKTLVEVLKKVRKNHGQHFLLRRQRIAIITYTNAAADEINHRLEQSILFQVSTIHSFCWDLIQGLTTDIREWVRQNLKEELADLHTAQAKSRDLNNKSSLERAVRIASKTKRLDGLDKISKFTYNPNGDNLSKDSLNHVEVVAITAHFINDKQLMREIVVDRFPIILIDESQDTKKDLVDAFFALQSALPNRISLGLLGDTMQRIYADGKENLGKDLPVDWLKPVKKMNHRSQKRIVELINTIRKSVDDKMQTARVEKNGGVARLFIAPTDANKSKVEDFVSSRMAELTGDNGWLGAEEQTMTLILEHHMAARRMQFLDFFTPLYENNRLRTGLLDGSLASIGLFIKILIPIIVAHQKGDQFTISRIVKNYSPLISKKSLLLAEEKLKQLQKAKMAVEDLLALWDNGHDPTGIAILQNLSSSGLFELHYLLRPLGAVQLENGTTDVDDLEESTEADQVSALEMALSAPFSQILHYDRYLSEKSQFGTHQGVKGLEYARVSVVIDDVESRGFLFKYEKLFGAAALSDGDRKNIQDGNDSVMDRTRRLFYVACSRAKESLAIIAYSQSPLLVQGNAKDFGWFADEEIEMVGKL